MFLYLSAGADNIKKYWSRYYQGSQGVVFVLDSASSDEDLEAARNELHSALQHPQLCTLPFLILANHQDKPAARTPNQVTCLIYSDCQFIPSCASLTAVNFMYFTNKYHSFYRSVTIRKSIV